MHFLERKKCSAGIFSSFPSPTKALQILFENFPLFIVKHFQIHDELQAPEWTEKGPLKRDWHGTTKMTTFQTHENGAATDMKMEQLR